MGDTVTSTIRSYFLQKEYLDVPKMKIMIKHNLFKSIGTTIEETEKFTVIETKHGEDLYLELFVVALTADELFNSLRIMFEKGYEAGMEKKQMFVQNKPKVCKEPGCNGKFYFIRNAEKQTTIPVDLETLSEQEVRDLLIFKEVIYDKTRHVSHFKTCKNPGRFSKSKFKKG